MLRTAQQIDVAARQVWLEILLDVVGNTEVLQQVNHAECVLPPVGRLGHREIVRTTHFVQVDETVRLLNDAETCFNIEGGFKADPCIDSVFVEFFESSKSITRQCGSDSHFREKESSKLVSVEAKAPRSGRNRSMSLSPRVPPLVRVHIPRPCSIRTSRVCRESRITWMIWIRCERQHHLFGDSSSLVHSDIFS